MNEMIHDIMDKKGAPVLIGLFIILFLAEGWSQLRVRKQRRTKRALINALFAVPGFLGLRLLLLPAMVWVAYKNQEWRIGLNYLYDLPVLAVCASTFVLLDYTNYLWHILNHKVSFLWRFHLVHHTDIDLDVTTAIRFHAGELIASVFYRGFAVFIIGATPMVVLIYEICFEAATQFHHSNWKLPFRWEKMLNMIFVTPRMHGIHHSVVRHETDSNYSVIFSFWDRLHNTIMLNIPQKDITIGVPVYSDPKELTIGYLLKLPFTKIRHWESNIDASGRQRKNKLQR